MTKSDGSHAELKYSNKTIEISSSNIFKKNNLICELDYLNRITKVVSSNGSIDNFIYNEDGYLIEQNNDNGRVELGYVNDNLVQIIKNKKNGSPQTILLTYDTSKLENVGGLLSLKELINNYTNSYIISNTPNNNWYDIAYSKKQLKYVAISTDIGDSVMNSSDGKIWKTYPTGNNNAWISLTYASQLDIFVAVSSSGIGNRVMTSKDGVSWVTRNSANDQSWRAITYSPELNLFVALSISGNNNRVMTSKDGITWDEQKCNCNNQWRSVIWVSDLKLFIAVASSGNGDRVMISEDGYNWEQKAGIKNNDWFSITYSPELKLLVCVADAGDDERIMISKDANDWRYISTEAFNNAWHGITYSSELNLFVAVAYSGINRIITSRDGINWSSFPTPTDNLWMSITYNNKLNEFVSVSKTGLNNRVMITKVDDIFYGSFDYHYLLQSQGYFGKLSKNLISSYYSNDTSDPFHYKVYYNFTPNNLVSSKEIVSELNTSKTYIYH